MAFIRRGTVKRPHKNSASFRLTRIDGTPFKCHLNHLQCWEEFQMENGIKITVVYWDLASSTAVRETFDAIDEAINGKAVAP